MKGLILSGGTGTRLRPITYTSAKQLVPVANKPILFYAIEAIRDANITDIGIITGDTGEEVKLAVGDGSKWGVNITYIPQEAPLGLAHAVKIAHDFIKDDDFVMYLGDNLVKDGINSLVEEFRLHRGYGKQTNCNCQILLSHVKEPQRFGVAELLDGKVVHLVEKPKKPKTDLALVGVYMFDKSIFEAVNSIKPSWRNELEITDAIQYLIDEGYDVHPHIIDGWWKDTGKLEDLLEANRIMLGLIGENINGNVDDKSQILGKVVVEKGAIIKESVIRGPVIIGSGSKIINSYIGPFTSIHDNVTIEGSEIEHSIILADCTIQGIGSRIEDTLLGKNVKVHKSNTKPKAYRLMVGDNSEIEVI
ncbi:glucose-1-phosphate thymidylyltransferase [Candidatus Oleimmundimicrobium sp.]|uniref:glucose-1-phosphate thymidylyltransferase n=1 Tax=Candidatus Oleimmundimicrobium sp. TaxID=3060597 RepID=UPI0027256C38|nr:glucose-1-phosphate thymidylyltransferase [Candidatus Oleimmundimicrobium sp.]MDO8886357.1 glucose-1-phosphate thymidylyltransferase [Candidatus Oleimmundimicrobium sp.]